MEFVGQTATLVQCVLLCLKHFPEGSERHQDCQGTDFILESNECYIPVNDTKTTTTATTTTTTTEAAPPPSGFLLITSGQKEESGHTTEVVPLGSGTQVVCPYNAKLKQKVLESIKDPTGGYVSDAPVVCDERSMKCYNIDIPEQDKFVSRLNQSRTYSFSLVLPAGNAVNDNGIIQEEVLWITGGKSQVEGGKRQAMKSTEFIRPERTTVIGPDLPTEMDSHCMAIVNDTTTLLTGRVDVIGKRSDNDPRLTAFPYRKGKLFLIHYKIGKFEEILDDAHGGTKDCSCGRVSLCTPNGGKAEPLIVVAGGIDYVYLKYKVKSKKPTKATWIYDTGSAKYFSNVGPDLPLAIAGAVSVTTSDGRLFHVGGMDQDEKRTNVILEMICTYGEDFRRSSLFFAKSCQWLQMESELLQGRSNFVAMLVPESYYTC